MREQRASGQPSGNGRRPASDSAERDERSLECAWPVPGTGKGWGGQKNREGGSVGDWIEPVAAWVGRHPGVSLGMAVGVGVLIGWLVKRR
jgi:hypothetical protein